MNLYLGAAKRYSIWKHLSIIGLLIGVVILSTAACSSGLSKQEINQRIKAEVGIQIGRAIALSDLKGEKGDTGPRGPAGEDTGPQGPQGERGPAGAGDQNIRALEQDIQRIEYERMEECLKSNPPFKCQ